MIIITDFDGVLLDDHRFKKDYLKLFEKFGVPSKIYLRAYHESEQKNKGRYEPQKHLAILKKYLPDSDVFKLNKEVNKFARHSAKYIFRDSALFLSAFRHNSRLILLSTGPNFQKEKVKYSGLTKFFNRVIVRNQFSKHDPILKILRSSADKKVVFIDDKKEVVDEVKKKIPQVLTIQMRRRNTVTKSRLADAVVGNLKQAQKVIKNGKIRRIKKT